MTAVRSARSTPRSLSLVAIGIVLLSSALVPSAGSNTLELADADDSPGALDISSVAHAHSERRLVHTITTHEDWDTALLAGPDAFFSLAFYFDGDLRRYVHVASSPDGTLYGEVRRWDGETVLGHTRVWKPDAKTLRVEFPKRTLRRDVKKYAWEVVSLYGEPGHAECDPATAYCVDEAPASGGPILVHRLN